MAFETAGEFEFEQYRPDVPRRRLGRPREFIDRHWRRTKELDDPLGDLLPRNRRRSFWRRRIGDDNFGFVGGRRSAGSRRFPRLDKKAVEFRQVELVPKRKVRLRRQIRLGKTEAFVRRKFLTRQRIQHILRFGAEGGAVAQKIIGAFRARIKRRARTAKISRP
jgi:hypothetical protein